MMTRKIFHSEVFFIVSKAYHGLHYHYLAYPIHFSLWQATALRQIKRESEIYVCVWNHERKGGNTSQ